ncbi:MAG: 1,4-beta-glucanase [Ruminococcus sp.]|uniref:dockerin type I domain-containing protein n=1 Tax=Ruminococcus sp. TaxID=41978 RepID=UPI0025DE99CF|nr:dockerin type I domain-containing protein [Ruminococcus sp.]MCR5601312.1 1,4-beta-glucanase [Ruminococcus sp.]
MKAMKKTLAGLCALCLSAGAVSVISTSENGIGTVLAATKDISSTMEWDTLKIGGAGFVSGIVTGKKEMYLRTDVGGAYRYDYSKKRWVQLFGFINEDDRGLLSCKGIAIDPKDDMTAYFLCGCAYFSNAKTVIFKTTDGGKTFTSVDVTDHIQVHGNGDGRECIEPIAVDPDNPDTIYAGGDVTAGKSALIKSTDGGKTWAPVMGYDELGLFSGELKYPSWTDHMVRGTEPAKLYNEQNGIGCVYIEGGKVYVGTSVTGQANVHVASVKDDKFEPIKALPNANYPLSITSDHNGNLFFTYIGGLAFAGASGGAYKYNIKSGKAEKLTVSDNAVGMIEVDKKDPNKMFARTCGIWSAQWCGTEWVQDDPSTPENEGTIAWGDYFFRSSDGGKTWENITPGEGPTDYTTGVGVKKFKSLPLDTNGYDWIYGKACHWGSGIVIDPRDPEGDRILLTSGNGVFACDNAWAEKDIQFYFQPDGVEECVSLDFYSTADGLDLSAIGDYDGFVHEKVDGIPAQYNPNMGSTSAITVCPQNTDVWARTANGDGNNTGSGYYTLDRGKTWKTFKPACTGGKLSITELSKGKYRVINTSPKGGASYSDDWGATWKDCQGIQASKGAYTLVDPEDAKTVYAVGAQYNEYWSSDMSKKEPTYDEAHYSYFVSEDYGATFKETRICPYNWELTWKFEHTGDLAYVKKGTVALAGANHGVYIISDKGKTVKHLENVAYAKCIGYGAPEKKGNANTLYIYGQPEKTDPEGIYRSTDEGATWVCINKDHLYGGTGNGNYIVGDMDEFGKVYMSTVGCGIVYGKIAGSEPVVNTTTTTNKTTTTTKPVATTDKNYKAGDSNCDGVIDLSDAVMIMQALANPNKYGLNGTAKTHITAQGLKNADVIGNNGMTTEDAGAIQRYLLHLIKEIPVKD